MIGTGDRANRLAGCGHGGAAVTVKMLDGSQQNWPPVQLNFDRSTQYCDSFCTCGGSHAPVCGDPGIFVSAKG